MAIGTTVQPPLMKNGNPLSAASVNQLIEATNFYGENVFGNNTGWQKFIGYGNITNSESRFALVHKYDTLYIKIYHQDNLTPFQVYAKKAGQNQTLYTIHTANAIPVGNSTTLTFNLATNPGGFSVNNGETYFIFLEWTNTNQNGMVMVEYLHEQQASYWSIPSIPTLSASTVVGDTYLNTLVNAVRNLRTLNYSTNFGFVGIKTNQFQSQSNTYLRWRLKRKNRYLQVGLTGINKGIYRIYLNDQLIKEETKTAQGIQDYQYVFDYTNLPVGITIPSEGVDYEIKVRFNIYQGEENAFIRVNYVWELPTP